MSSLLPTYQRRPLEFQSGTGNYLIDVHGKKYLDLTSGIGVNNLGYSDQNLLAAVEQQLHLLWHSPNIFESQLQEEVAAKLAGESDYLTFFCNSGTEANEAALKLIRKHSQKSKIITFKDSFHGRTYGSLSATGQAKIHAGFGPLLPDFHYVAYNDLAAFEAALDSETAGVLLEVIQGEGGVTPADPLWLAEVAKRCRQAGVLLAIDEIQTGIGRTGTFFAYEHYDIEPDIVTLAKALGNGLPVGALLAKGELAASFGPGSHGSTFGGNRIALRAAKVVVEAINQPDFLADVKAKGDFFKEQLVSALKDLDHVKEVRGRGLMLGIELKDNPQAYVAALAEQGVLVLTAGATVIRLLPPLTITKAEISTSVTKIAAVLSQA